MTGRDVALVQRVVFRLEGRRLGDERHVRIGGKRATLGAAQLEVVDRKAYRHTGIAVRALRPVDMVPAATEAVLRQRGVRSDIRSSTRVDEDRDGAPSRQVAALVGRSQEESEIRSRCLGHSGTSPSGAPVQASAVAPIALSVACRISQNTRRAIGSAPRDTRCGFSTWQSSRTNPVRRSRRHSA